MGWSSVLLGEGKEEKSLQQFLGKGLWHCAHEARPCLQWEPQRQSLEKGNAFPLKIFSSVRTFSF